MMDSGNSGSLQSSSGDEEYDSRADSISVALMNNLTSSRVGPNISNPTPPSLPPPPSSAVFDPLSNFFDPNISRNPNSLLNLDLPWSNKTLRSDPNYTENINSNSALNSLFAPPPPHQVPIPQVPETASGTNTPRSAADHAHVVRNPKKRSRASRRAPTTVLTTDTTNFRAMVQEFTGIPAPPFTASTSPFPRTRFDLYGTSAASTMRSTNFDGGGGNLSQPPYLRRPFPQKVQLPPPPFLASSSSAASSSGNLIIDHHAIASSNANATSASINNFQLSSELGLFKQPQQTSSLFNIPSPILTSFLQSNPAKITQGSSLDEFGLGPLNSGLPGLISSDHQTVSRNDNNSMISWGNGNGIGSFHENHDQCQVLRNAANGKLNFSSSSSGFQGDHKGADNVVNVAAAAPPGGGGAGRGEGMMESWICSSELK